MIQDRSLHRLRRFTYIHHEGRSPDIFVIPITVAQAHREQPHEARGDTVNGKNYRLSSVARAPFRTAHKNYHGAGSRTTLDEVVFPAATS
jgi:hypothetical protein